MILATIFNTGTKYFHDEYLEMTDNFKFAFEKAWKESGLNQREFCEKLQISKRTFLRYMNGDIPTRKMFCKIKDYIY